MSQIDSEVLDLEKFTPSVFETVKLGINRTSSLISFRSDQFLTSYVFRLAEIKQTLPRNLPIIGFYKLC